MRSYQSFECRGARFRICCDRMDSVLREIVLQREVLEQYLLRHPPFGVSFVPVAPLPDAPEVARRMAQAASVTGVGPMAAVAGAMAQLAAEAGLRAGAREAIVENGGDIYIAAAAPVVMSLYAGATPIADKLAFRIPAGDTPLAVCSSSGRMGHSTSLGDCDLATVVAADAALADAAATLAANLVRTPSDIDAALARVAALPGISGVLLVKDDRVGMQGRLPALVRSQAH